MRRIGAATLRAGRARGGDPPAAAYYPVSWPVYIRGERSRAQVDDRVRMAGNLARKVAVVASVERVDVANVG